jgi:putative transposase
MIWDEERGTSMSKNRHTESQMIGVLKQLEAGPKAEDVAREVGVSKHTIYAWKAKYGGMDVSRAQEAKQLRDENTKLRKLVGRWSTKLCLRESSRSLEAGLKHGIELGKYRTDGPARSSPTAVLQRGDV